MYLGLQFKERMQALGELGGLVVTQFLSLIGSLQTWSEVEHNDDGTHSAITAENLTTTEDVTVGEDLAVGGVGVFEDNVTAKDVDATNTNAYRTEIGNVGSPTRSAEGGGIRMRNAVGSRLWTLTAHFLTSASEHAVVISDESSGLTSPIFRFKRHATGSYHLSPSNAARTPGAYLGDGSALPSERWSGLYADDVSIADRLIVGLALEPAQITANQNNYNPTGFLLSPTVLLSSDAARNITGFAAGAFGQRIRLLNAGGFTITLKFNDAASSLGNRILNAGNNDALLLTHGSLDLEYQVGAAGGADGYWWVQQN